MSELVGYEAVKCQINLPGCQKKGAGYSRRKQYAQEGPWLDSCESCARKPYDQPKQFAVDIAEVEIRTAAQLQGGPNAS